MSIIQQHTSATLGDGWRRINIDALNEDSSVNFDTSTLVPPQPEISETEAKQLAGQIRQLLRGGDAAGALRGCLDSPVYNGTDAAKVRKGKGARSADDRWTVREANGSATGSASAYHN
jgi:actin related protein 2/3 complex, subunit 5